METACTTTADTACNTASVRWLSPPATECSGKPVFATAGMPPLTAAQKEDICSKCRQYSGGTCSVDWCATHYCCRTSLEAVCACPTEDTAGWKDSYDYTCTQYATGTAGTSWCLDSRYDSFHSRSNCVQVKKKMAEMRLALFVVVRVYTVMVCLVYLVSLNDSNIEPPPPPPSPLPSSFLLSLSLFPLFQCCVEAGGTTQPSATGSTFNTGTGKNPHTSCTNDATCTHGVMIACIATADTDVFALAVSQDGNNLYAATEDMTGKQNCMLWFTITPNTVTYGASNYDCHRNPTSSSNTRVAETGTIKIGPDQTTKV